MGRFARAVLDVPLPWTRMRRVYALLGLCKRFGDVRVEEACAQALAVELLDVRRLERMVVSGERSGLPSAGSAVVPLHRYLRPARQYALRPMAASGREEER